MRSEGVVLAQNAQAGEPAGGLLSLVAGASGSEEIERDLATSTAPFQRAAASANGLRAAIAPEAARFALSRSADDRAAPLQPLAAPQRRHWVARHPVLFGTLVGFVGGYLIGYLPGDDAVFDDFTAQFNGTVMGGIGAGTGALVGAVVGEARK